MSGPNPPPASPRIIAFAASRVATGRTPGWIAHWREMRAEGARINRPRQIYTGFQSRHYLPIEDRG